MENENKWEYDYSSANNSQNTAGETGYPNVGSSGMNTANTAATYGEADTTNPEYTAPRQDSGNGGVTPPPAGPEQNAAAPGQPKKQKKDHSKLAKSAVALVLAAAMGFAGSMMDGSVTVAFEPPELRGVNLKKHLSNILGLPAAAKRDMELVAKGYAVRRMARTVVCIYIGHAGMGAGIVLDGRVWSGAHGFAGEIHFLPIENNLKYAENHFEGADMTAYCTSVVRSLAALLDPECIVFYRAPRFDGITERVRTACAALLPASAMPEITLSNEWIEDYEAGLFATACEEENA